MVVDGLVADQFNYFIVFYNTCWPPKRSLSPFAVAYMAPRLNNKYYVCNQLWDKLESSVQRSNNVFEFTKKNTTIETV